MDTNWTICVVLCPHVLVAPMVLARALAGAGLTLVTLFSGSSAGPLIYFPFLANFQSRHRPRSTPGRDRVRDSRSRGGSSRAPALRLVLSAPWSRSHLLRERPLEVSAAGPLRARSRR